MNDLELQKIENTLEVILPVEYKRILQNYPFKDKKRISDFELWSISDDIIRENTRIRRDGFFGIAWPKKFFLIGSTGAGDYFFLNLEENNTKVRLAWHEDGFNPKNLTNLETYPTLNDYIKYVSGLDTSTLSSKEIKQFILGGHLLLVIFLVIGLFIAGVLYYLLLSTQ